MPGRILFALTIQQVEVLQLAQGGGLMAPSYGGTHRRSIDALERLHLLEYEYRSMPLGPRGRVVLTSLGVQLLALLEGMFPPSPQPA